jgi:hypothetical protein
VTRNGFHPFVLAIWQVLFNVLHFVCRKKTFSVSIVEVNLFVPERQLGHVDDKIESPDCPLLLAECFFQKIVCFATNQIVSGTRPKALLWWRKTEIS